MPKAHVEFTGRISGPILCSCGKPMDESAGRYMCLNTKCPNHGKFFTAVAMRGVLFYRAEPKK